MQGHSGTVEATGVSVPLAVLPSVKMFSSIDKSKPGYGALQDQLEVMAATVQLKPLNRPEDVLLAFDGTIDGYRLTTTALRQVCRRLSRGLAQLVFDVAGLYGTRSLVEPRLAIHAINALIKLRFRDTLAGCQLICNRLDMTIDGIVGARYRFIHNRDLVMRCHDHLVQVGQVVFHEATLYGRKLVVRYRQPEPAFVLNGPVTDRFFCGYHFANSEVGDTALKCAVILLRAGTNTAAMAAYAQSSRLPHVQGKAFERKFTSFLAKVQLRIDPARELLPKLEQLQTLLLGIQEPGEQFIQQRKAIVRMLMARGLSQDAAKQACRLAIIRGSYPEPAVAENDEKALFDRYRSRSYFDLFNAVGALAKGEVPEYQEKLERVAYKLLIGNVS